MISAIPLTRLVAVAAEARENPRLAAAAFEDKDAPGVADISSCDITSYVEEMRLEKVVQRIWMAELAARLGIVLPWQVAIGETRRQALMNVQASLQDRPGYAVGVQLQWRSLKAFCAPFPYPEKASEDQHQMVEGILQTIRSALSLGNDAKSSRTGERGFRSYTVDTLPRGRNFDEWIDILKPRLERLYSVFPSVTSVIPSAIPIENNEVE